jgi:hypothetical protein
MSCEECNTAHELRGPELGKHCYVRIGLGNVELVGCEEHLRDAIAFIRIGQGTLTSNISQLLCVWKNTLDQLRRPGERTVGDNPVGDSATDNPS